ncbi:MAG: O-antigen ligase family protein [bacterium]
MFDYFLLFFAFVSLLAGQFARIELFNGAVNGYVQEGILFIFICSAVYRFGFGPLKKFFNQKTILIMTACFLISLLLSFTQFTFPQNGVAILYLLRLMLYAFFGVYLFHLIHKRKMMKIKLDSLLLTFSILLLVISAIQYFFFPNFWGLYPYGWDPHLYRVSATYFDVYVAAALYGLLAFFWFQKDKKILAFCFMIALIGTFSRSAYIAFILGVIVMFVSRKKWKELVIICNLFLILVLFVPKPFGEGVRLFRTASINSRIKDYQVALLVWSKKPLFGYGYNHIGAAKEQLNLVLVDDKSHSLSSFHSSYLIILATTGIIGFISFVLMIGYWIIKYPIIRVYFVYIFCMSLFDNALLHVLILFPLILILCSRYYSSLE